MTSLLDLFPPPADLAAPIWQATREKAESETNTSDFADPPTWADEHVDAETFDPQAYLDRFDRGRLDTDSTYRRAATRRDVLLFGLVYLPHHLRSDATGGQITFADPHLDWCRRARRWMEPVTEPRSSRHAEVAPRETGKTTWFYLIIPLWAAAHGYIKFLATFADSTGQAETHLSTFKRELETNRRLREDYPDLCAPARRQSGTTIANRQGMMHQRNGFTFAARGIDSSNLGLKVNERRPDVIVLDDVEPDEANYSPLQAGKRLSTIVDAILPMNLRAHVLLVGTVTMPGSIIHQLVRAAAGEPPEGWIVDERFQAHHAQPIVVRDDGTERSIWPAKWPMSLLNDIRHTRSYRKNFANDPLGTDGGYWTVDDFRYGDLEGVTRTIMWIDPATTTKRTSDFTGISIIGFAPGQVAADSRGRRVVLPSRCIVREAWEVKLTGDPLRTQVLKLLTRHPEVGVVVVESNQGGEHWHAILHHLPVRLAIVHESVKKEVRAERALNHYQRGRVLHAKKLVRLEEQMVAFPRAPHDDLVDAVTGPLTRLLSPSKVGRTRTEFPR
jgi:phage terminase large subunit-like protein